MILSALSVVAHVANHITVRMSQHVKELKWTHVLYHFGVVYPDRESAKELTGKNNVIHSCSIFLISENNLKRFLEVSYLF